MTSYGLWYKLTGNEFHQRLLLLATVIHWHYPLAFPRFNIDLGFPSLPPEWWEYIESVFLFNNDKLSQGFPLTYTGNAR